VGPRSIINPEIGLALTGVSFGQTPRKQASIVPEKEIAGMARTLCGLLGVV
jgi:hypothetical protein